jgi:hypothetical protein
METLVKADIFFFVTTIAVVVVSLLGVIVLVYAIRILRDVKDVSSRVRTGSELIGDDLAKVRTHMKHYGLFKAVLAALLALAGSVYKRKAGTGRSKKTSTASKRKHHGKKEDE